jgi:hypothetical protein
MMKNSATGQHREIPFLPRVGASPPSLLVIFRSTSGRFSTAGSPFVDRIFVIISAALNHIQIDRVLACSLQVALGDKGQSKGQHPNDNPEDSSY